MRSLESGTTSRTYLLDSGVVRKSLDRRDLKLFDQEVIALTRLFLAEKATGAFPRFFPAILGSNSAGNLLHLDLEYCGERINRHNLPGDYWDQAEKIINALHICQIYHPDIHKKNVLVHDGVLKLVDWGDAVCANIRLIDLLQLEKSDHEYRPYAMTFSGQKLLVWFYQVGGPFEFNYEDVKIIDRQDMRDYHRSYFREIYRGLTEKYKWEGK